MTQELELDCLDQLEATPAQIAELVRARKHLQAAGKLGDSYRLKP